MYQVNIELILVLCFIIRLGSHSIIIENVNLLYFLLLTLSKHVRSNLIVLQYDSWSIPSVYSFLCKEQWKLLCKWHMLSLPELDICDDKLYKARVLNSEDWNRRCRALYSKCYRSRSLKTGDIALYMTPGFTPVSLVYAMPSFIRHMFPLPEFGIGDVELYKDTCSHWLGSVNVMTSFTRHQFSLLWHGIGYSVHYKAPVLTPTDWCRRGSLQGTSSSPRHQAMPYLTKYGITFL